jgi:hypothetical protein
MAFAALMRSNELARCGIKRTRSRRTALRLQNPHRRLRARGTGHELGGDRLLEPFHL